MTELKIIKIEKNSAADKLNIPCCTLLKIDGRSATDILDLFYAEGQSRVELTVLTGGSEQVFVVEKDENEPLGLVLDEKSYLNTPVVCANKCVFCFVDQLPRGMRSTMYVKDDDWRLSFACGNFVTLTNVCEAEIERIIEKKFSPIYVSVHATDAQVRQRLLGIKRDASIMPLLARLAAAGIIMHTQIVLVPGINDGEVLQQSLEELYSLYPAVKSVAVVPVGLTGHREHLPEIQPVDKACAVAAVELIEYFEATHPMPDGGHFAFAADELYIKSEIALPAAEFYGDFEQIENGVGLVGKLEAEFFEALENVKRARKTQFCLITGVSAAPILEKLITAANARIGGLRAEVIEIQNDYFGRSVTVAGLVCACDIIAQTQGKIPRGATVLLPRVMLRETENVFLDGMSLKTLEKQLKRRIKVVQSGYEVCSALFKVKKEK